MYPFSSKDSLLDLIGEDDGRVPQIFISYALNYFCVFVIFSLFRPFFLQVKSNFFNQNLLQIFIWCHPKQYFMENVVYRYWFHVFMFWMYNLLFDFLKNNIMFHGNNLATTTPKKIRQSKALFLVFMCISSVVW